MPDINSNKANASSPDFLRTDGGKTKSNAIEVPSISLPKGGGAIKGIDEKFAVNAVNGTASLSVALPFSAARGASPSLSLSYNSGSGNGLFGLGWRSSLPSITRKMDKGLPQYFDATDSDTYLLSEAEDLVPEYEKVTKPDGTLEFKLDGDGGYIKYELDSPDGTCTIRFYKPRIEGLFARIERWTDKNTGRIKWRVLSKDNHTTLFGWTLQSVCADPGLSGGARIFEWLPEFEFDDKGNCCQYIYKKEDKTGFDLSLLYNKNRRANGQLTYTNIYPEKIIYGNKTPYKKFGDAFPAETDYLFQTIFDYGEYDLNAPFAKIKDWDFRKDPFSDYKPGFEIRTTRLCRRVLLFHFFDELPGGSAMVRSIQFDYDQHGGFTFLTSITSAGYIKKTNGTYTSKSLPPAEFQYQQPDWSKEVKSISVEDIVHAPAGADEQPYQFTDLYNEGLSGILTEQASGWFYKHNLGDGKFERAKLVSPKPSFSGLGRQLHLADLDADGGKQLVSYDQEPRGFFELDDDNQWKLFRNFENFPNIDLNDPDTRMIDLNGDGRAEILITEDSAFTWYESEGRTGYTRARKSINAFDEEGGPCLVFSDAQQTIFLADMSGDGMTDIVRIRNGEICYWPNLGYGKFGSKVAMEDAPVFDHPELFNPAFLRLADIDGSGVADIIYLGKNKFSCWMNLNGNAFHPTAFETDAFPQIDGQSRVTVADLLGNGVACIVWSTGLPGEGSSPIRYIDLMNSKKPHILVFYKNNLGKEVVLTYTASTQFYIEDKLAGRPWITKLHFPVHCVAKTDTVDKISGWRWVSSYKYHHGYYDHEEGEFRGFGMVEQTDAEDFEHWQKADATNITDAQLHQEPVVTKTWFHTGAYLRREKILRQFASEYWYAEMKRQGFPVVNAELDLPDARIIPAINISNIDIDPLSAVEWREALRSCKGMALRSEVFAYDAPAIGATAGELRKQLTPYTVATHNCVIELLQPKGNNKHAIFVVKESESISYSYERDTADPRISHNLNTRWDEYGNMLESASVVYPRLLADPSLPLQTQAEQGKTVILYKKNQFTNDVTGADIYRLRVPSEEKTYELKGVKKTGGPSLYYSLADFDDILSKSIEISYPELEREADNTVPPAAYKPLRRRIEHIRTNYLRNDLGGPLPLHQLESLALPFESYQQAYTPELLADIFGPINIAGSKITDALLVEGKYCHSEGDNNWWIRSGSMQFLAGAETAADAQNRFYVPISYTDPYNSKTKLTYYSNYFLLIKKLEDELNNVAQVDLFNFRTLAPQRIRDINNNLSEGLSDELGLVKAFAVFGKGNEADDLAGLTEFTDPVENGLIHDFFTVPDTAGGVTDSILLNAKANQLLQHATTRFVYDIAIYKNTGQPTVVASISREEHFAKNNASPLQLSFEYSNGLGKVVMKKQQAEPGPAKIVHVNPDNSYTVADIDTSKLNPTQLRWIGNGREVLNNKGNTVKQYEPYFSASNKYETFKELVETGVTAVVYYDAIGRVIKTSLPDGTLSRVEFDSWKQVEFDANDNSLDPACSWYLNRHNRLIDAELIAEGKDPATEKIAADKAALHANTPIVLHFNTLGAPVLSIEHNRNIQTAADEFNRTKIKLDPEGNLRSVTDAREIPGNGFLGNPVSEYKYDMLGNMVYQQSMDTGQRWRLQNILGKPLRSWDERGLEVQYFYDPLHRPTQSIVKNGDGALPLNNIFDRMVYGESLLLPGRTNEVALQAINVLGKPIQHYDTAGRAETPAYDFKGQPKSVTRKLFKKYKEAANWTDANLVTDLEGDAFSLTTEIDALGRISSQTAPDNSTITPSYNRTGLFKGEKVDHVNPSLTATYIKKIEYNEKGQRSRIIYGNDVSTDLYYDKFTFRLIRLQSKRLNNDPLQDWRYTFDAVGNITQIEDKEIPVTFFGNQKISGVSEYTYDALYRLREAKGRENNAALNFGDCDNWNDAPFIHQMNPGDPMSIRNYVQSYQYDPVGNILEMKHVAAGGNWTRNYTYETGNNRIKTTHIGANGAPSDYTQYDHHPKHGFLIKLPHLEDISWDFKEAVVRTTRQHCTGDNIPVITYYQYDAAGQRIRKITENPAGAGGVPSKKDERIYIAGYEVYRGYLANAINFERQSLSLLDKGHRFVIVETVVKNLRVNPDPSDLAGTRLTRYQLDNHLMSAALELDGSAQANVLSYEEYHPFGTTAYQAYSAAIKTSRKRYRFTGMERDEETGLEYHSARYYLPWLGRWLSADPAGIIDGANLYKYSKNNPIGMNDTRGTQCDPNLATCPQLMQNWSYDTPVPNRASVGHNVQRDHPIQVSLRKEQRGGNYNRAVSSSRAEQTVLVETGRGYFHTEVGRLQAEINERVRSGLITSESELIEATREAYRLAGAATGVEVNAEALDRAIVSNLATLSERASQTSAELRAAGVANSDFPSEAAVDRAFADPTPAGPPEPPIGPPAPPAAEHPPVAAAVEAPRPVAANPVAEVHPTAPTPSPSVPELPPGPGRLARTGQWAAETAPAVLKFAGEVLTVYGAVNEGAKSDAFERAHGRGELNAFVIFAGTVSISVAAGVVDDALAVAATAVSGSPAPVMDSWEANGSGPVQHAAGEAIRGFLGWSFAHGF